MTLAKRLNSMEQRIKALEERFAALDDVLEDLKRQEKARGRKQRK